MKLVNLLTVLTQRHIEQTIRCAWWTSRTEAHIFRIPINGRENIDVRRESVARYTVTRFDFLFEFQR